MRLIRPSLLAAVMLASSLGAQPASVAQQAGDFRFQLPSDWQRSAQGPSVVFAPPGVTRGRTTVLAMYGHALQGTLRENFDAEWASVLRTYRVQKAYPVTVNRTTRGIDMVTGQAALADSAGGLWIAQFMCAQYGSRFEAVMFLSNDFQSTHYPDAMRGMQQFLATLRFGPDAPTGVASASPPVSSAPAPTPAPTGIPAGVYRSRLATRNTLNQFGPAASTLVFKYATIFADRVFLQSQPNGGLDGFDRDAEMRANPVGWGVIDLRGGSGTITFPPTNATYDRTPTVWQLSVRGPGITANRWDYDRLDPGDGVRLQGTFRRADDNEYARQTITFTPDGRFTDEGVFRAAAVTYRTARSPFEDDDGVPGTGTWAVTTYTLRLTFTDGRVKRAFFYLPDGQSRTDVRTIVINTNRFVRIR